MQNGMLKQTQARQFGDKKRHANNYIEGDEAELFKILDFSLDVAVSILDENLNYKFLSQSTYEELGLTSNEIGPGDSLEHCHNLMRTRGLLNDEILEKNKLSPSLEKEKQITKNDFTSSIVELANGTVQKLVRKTTLNGHVISMSTNITDLVEKERLLENALSLGNAGYWIYDFKNKSHKISHSVENFVTENVNAQIKTQGIIAFIHPDDRHKFKTAMSKLKETDGTFEFTARVLNKTPRKKSICAFTGVVVKNKAGEWLKLRTFIQDVTIKRKRAQELERAKDEALSASRAKTQFVANMSHEIRTPMNGIAGMAELLADTNITDQQREFISVIKQSSNALLTIVNDILDLSKIESGALSMNPRPFNLRNAVSDVNALLSPREKDTNVELIVNYPEGLGENFIGDDGRIRQILTNLVGNALKFTKQGHVIIDVHIIPAQAESSVIKIDVKDTGIGIDPSKTEAIFKKFTQADGSTTRLYGGTGLGLSITKHLVELMNGDVRVASKLGEGSTFSFEIPLPHAQVPSVGLNEAVMQETHHTIENTDRGDTHPSPPNGSRGTATSSLHKSDMDYLDKVFQDLEDATFNFTNSENNEAADIAINQNEIQNTAQAGPQLDPSVLDDFSLDKSIFDGQSLECSVSEATSFLPETFLAGSLTVEAEHILSTNSQFDAFEDKIAEVNETLDDDTEFENILMQIDAQEHVYEPIQISTVNPQIESAEEIAQGTPKDTHTVMNDDHGVDLIEVLVAEDFPLNQDVVRLMLSETRFRPTFANNGQEALETYSATPQKFSLILMDVSMPVMDGYECTKKIQNYNREHDHDQIPIIALTGHALAHDRQLCIDAGMDDYMTKPVQKASLMERLEHHYNKRSKSGFPIAPFSVAS